MQHLHGDSWELLKWNDHLSVATWQPSIMLLKSQPTSATRLWGETGCWTNKTCESWIQIPSLLAYDPTNSVVVAMKCRMQNDVCCSEILGRKSILGSVLLWNPWKKFLCWTDWTIKSAEKGSLHSRLDICCLSMLGWQFVALSDSTIWTIIITKTKEVHLKCRVTFL